MTNYYERFKDICLKCVKCPKCNGVFERKRNDGWVYVCTDCTNICQPEDLEAKCNCSVKCDCGKEKFGFTEHAHYCPRFGLD